MTPSNVSEDDDPRGIPPDSGRRATGGDGDPVDVGQDREAVGRSGGDRVGTR